MIQAYLETGAFRPVSSVCTYGCWVCHEKEFNFNVPFNSLFPYCFWLSPIPRLCRPSPMSFCSTYRVSAFIFKCLIRFGFCPSLWCELQVWLFPYGYPIILTPLKKKEKSLHTDLQSRLSHTITFQMQLALFLDFLSVPLACFFMCQYQTPNYRLYSMC